jgi:hypothetical protein
MCSHIGPCAADTSQQILMAGASTFVLARLVLEPGRQGFLHVPVPQILVYGELCRKRGTPCPILQDGILQQQANSLGSCDLGEAAQCLSMATKCWTAQQSCLLIK